MTYRCKFQELTPSSAGGGSQVPCFGGEEDEARLVADGGRLYTTQCTHGCGDGASGSSQIKAKDTVPKGTPLHANGGERLSPFLAYTIGIVWPFSKPELVNSKVSVFVFISVAWLWIPVVVVVFEDGKKTTTITTMKRITTTAFASKGLRFSKKTLRCRMP